MEGDSGEQSKAVGKKDFLIAPANRVRRKREVRSSHQGAEIASQDFSLHLQLNGTYLILN